MYNDKEFLEHYEKQKACFEKEIEETRKMIKEVIGEENEGYYRISQMLRLIEFDYNELLEAAGNLAEAVNEAVTSMEEVKETQDLIQQRLEKGNELDFLSDQDLDVMSEIVKRANKLDESNQRLVLSYVTGVVSASKNERLKNALIVRKSQKKI